MLEPEPLQQIDRTYVRKGARKLSYFSGCDYFRLSSHPKVIAAAQHGAKAYGLNVSASRLTTGNHWLYRKLEEKLAQFFKAPNALLTPTGYVTNLIVAQALSGNFSHVLIDQLAHASLSDAARALDCPIVRFQHLSAEDLSLAVQRCGPQSRPILLTDGLYANDGSVAPLKRYLKILPRDSWLLVDDAHAAGVLGRAGRGSIESEGISRNRIIQTITLSKAFGAYGGAIVGTANLRHRILTRSKLFIGSTPIPLPMANAALQSLEILNDNRALRKRLNDNTDYVRTALRQAGLSLSGGPGPMIGLPSLPRSQTLQLRRKLLDAQIYPPFVRYPGGPSTGYFRFVISSEHSRQQLEQLATVLVRTLTPQ